MTSIALRRILPAVPRVGKIISKRREFSALVSLDEEFPGLPSTSPSKAKASSPTVSTLPSGLTVVTEDASSSTTVSLTFPKAGSASEMLNEQGAALVNKFLAFNSGSGISTIMIWRNIEDDGGIPFVDCGRFGAALGYTCPPENAARLVPLLATDCSFEKWDVRDSKKKAGIVVEEAQSSAQVVLTENIYAAAFGPQSPPGRPFYYSSPGSVGLSDIKAFRARAYGVKGAVLAATGISDHDAFVKQVQEGLSESPAGSSEAAAPALYLGGESRLASAGGSYAHVALAFDGTSVSAPVLNVVKYLFQLSGAESGVTGFSSESVVGLYAGSASPGGLVDCICGAATKISPRLIKRAKVMAKAEALFALDGGSKSLASAMTASVLESGTFTGAAGLAAAYDAINDKDVEAAVSAMFKKTPALAAVGNITSVPYLGSVMSRFS